MNNTLTIRFKLTLFLALTSIQFGCAFNGEDLKDTVSTDSDSSIVHKEFSNGFKYYLKPIATETDELTLQFIVKAGLNQEASDQYTLSHFMEHIALTSGKHESTSVLYGTNRARELNLDRTSITAYTGRDHTAFIIKIDNTTKAKKFAFRLLKDIMNDLQIIDRYVDSERIPFFDESEFRGGESSLVRQDFILDSRILGVSHIPPKNYPSFIYNFDKEKLIRFYNDWYRPDLMRLSITGSIKDISGLQKELRHWFASVPKAKTANPKTNINNNYLKLPQRYIKRIRPALYKDRYATEVRYRLYFRNYKKPNSSKEEKLVSKLKQDLLKNTLNAQYRQVSEKNGWPFVLAIDYPEYPSSLKIMINTPDKYEEKALSASLKTLKQLKKYGFSSGVFNEEKEKVIKSIKRASQNSSRYWKTELRKTIVTGEYLPEDKSGFLVKQLQKIKEQDIHEYLTANVSDLPDDIGFIAPQNHQLLKQSKKDIRQRLSKIIQTPVTKIKEDKLPQHLIDLKSRNSFKKINHDELESAIPGVKKYRFDNGLNLILKSFKPRPDFLNQQNAIKFKGINNCGSNCFDSGDFHSAINAPYLVRASGVGEFEQWQLKRFLKDKKFRGSVTPFIKPNTSGISGRVTEEQLEIALQLIYMYMKHPRKDNEKAKYWKENAPDLFLSYLHPDDFRTHIRKYIKRPDFLPLGTKRVEGIQQIDIDNAYAIYQTLMGQPDSFTFIFTGDFDEEKVFKLCKKYLGNLTSEPQPKKMIHKAHTDYRKTSGLSKQWISDEKMNNILVEIIYNDELKTDEPIWKQKAKLKVLTSLLEIVLMKELRMTSEQGGSYSLSTTNHHDSKQMYHEIGVLFSCSQKGVKRLEKELFQVIENLKNTPVTNDMLQTALKEIPGGQETNPEMLSKLIVFHDNPSNWYNHKTYKDYLMSLNPKEMHEFARRLLKNNPDTFKLIPKN